MFLQGTLIYIDDFDFSSIDGSLTKINSFRDKYLLILDSFSNNSSIFCCFATTLKKEIAFHKVAQIGCNKNHFKYNVFHFEPYKGITDINFIFPSPTYIAGNKGQVFEYDLVTLYQKYHLNDKISNKGILHKQLLFDIIQCLYSSSVLENDIKENLFEIGDAIYNVIQKEDEENRT